MCKLHSCHRLVMILVGEVNLWPATHAIESPSAIAVGWVWKSGTHSTEVPWLTIKCAFGAHREIFSPVSNLSVVHLHRTSGQERMIFQDIPRLHQGAQQNKCLSRFLLNCPIEAFQDCMNSFQEHHLKSHVMKHATWVVQMISHQQDRPPCDHRRDELDEQLSHSPVSLRIETYYKLCEPSINPHADGYNSNFDMYTSHVPNTYGNTLDSLVGRELSAAYLIISPLIRLRSHIFIQLAQKSDNLRPAKQVPSGYLWPWKITIFNT